jgi:hypothetical protein
MKVVLSTPCATPTPPEFSFKFTDDGAAYNLEVLRKYNLNLGKALKAQQDSPLGNRKEFNAPWVLQQVFGLHPQWNQMEAFLLERSKWPLTEISKNEQQQDLVDTLTFGNHKGALQKSVILKKLIAKDIKYRYSLPVPLSSIQLIPGLVMAPMNIMEQNTIDKFGWIIQKDRLTHDQSWKWSSGTSVNSGVWKELLHACQYGFCICRLINWAIAARKKYPGQRILATKIDYKLAYPQGILHFVTALQTATQLPEGNITIIILWLTFGGTPCPFEWGIMSESICDLVNKFLKCKEWDPLTLHALVQADILTWEYLDDNVPFAMRRELIVDVPVDPRGYADVHIDIMTRLTINLPGTCYANRLEVAILLAIEVAAQPNNINKPIPREPMVAQEKLKAEGGLAKKILGWHFNFCTLTVTLLKQKHIAWSSKIWTMIATGRTTKKALESTIGQLGHVGFVIPWVFHFLSCLRTLLSQACNKRAITINKNCKNNLVLMLKILDKSKGGIDMNLLRFCSPTEFVTWTHARRPWRLQQSGLHVALQNSRQPALLHVKQSAWVPCGNNHAVDRHNWWTTQPRGLCTVDDRQHNGQRLDEKNQTSAKQRQPHPSIDSCQRSKKICTSIFGCGRKRI